MPPTDRPPPGAVAVQLGEARWSWIDDGWAERVLAHSWHPDVREDGRVYAYAHIDGRKVYLHRLVLNAPAGMHVDHIGGSATTLDNRERNLRLATPSQNARNSAVARGRVPLVGVSLDSRSGLYVSRIWIGHRTRLTIGRFRTEAAAGHAYDHEAVKRHGAFARTNADEGRLPPNPYDQPELPLFDDPRSCG